MHKHSCTLNLHYSTFKTERKDQHQNHNIKSFRNYKLNSSEKIIRRQLQEDKNHKNPKRHVCNFKCKTVFFCVYIFMGKGIFVYFTHTYWISFTCCFVHKQLFLSLWTGTQTFCSFSISFVISQECSIMCIDVLYIVD